MPDVTSDNPSTPNHGDDDKLIPEWGVDGDDQVVLAGLLVVGVLALVIGWTAWRGGDDTSTADPDEAIAAVVDDDADDETAGDETALDEAAVDEAGESDEADDIDEDEAEVTTQVVPLDLTPDVQAAVDVYGVTASADGDVATLTGAVGTTADSAAAEAAAAAVPGVITVMNQLMVLEGPVVQAMADNGAADIAPQFEGRSVSAIGVVGTEAQRSDVLSAIQDVEGVDSVSDRLRVLAPDVDAALADSGVAGGEFDFGGGIVTVRGTIADETSRQPALDAVSAIEGITDVIDELELAPPVEDELNRIVEAEPIQFATGSNQILDASNPTIDEVAAIISAGPADSVITIEGYTDVRGPDQANLQLSQARADAVRNALIDRGIPAERLVAVGRGETTQFADGDSPEALEANRRVQFVLG